MTVDEARNALDAFRERHGVPAPIAGPEPTTLAEVVDVLLGDRFPDYDAAFAVAETKEGVEALALQAQIRLSAADILRIVERILEELATRREADRALAARRAEAGDEAAAERADALAEDVASYRRAARAAGTLSRRALAEGESIVDELVRRYPSEQLSYVLLANVHRLRRNWNEFDKAIRRAEGLGEQTLLMRYQRALEAHQRYADRAAYTEMLDAVLADEPGFVRAQAYRVFAAQDVEARHVALVRLKALSPGHPVVVLAGPVLDAEYEARRELGAAGP